MQRILTQSSVLLVLSQWSVTCSCRSLRVSCNHSVILQPYMQASTVIVSTLLFIPSPLSVPSHRVFNFVRWYETHKLLSPGQKQISTQSSSIRSYANGKWSVWPVDRVTLHEICETQNNPTPRFFFFLLLQLNSFGFWKPKCLCGGRYIMGVPSSLYVNQANSSKIIYWTRHVSESFDLLVDQILNLRLCLCILGITLTAYCQIKMMWG